MGKSLSKKLLVSSWVTVKAIGAVANCTNTSNNTFEITGNTGIVQP